MGRIQTGIGLTTGLDISGTVEKLMALAARPKELLEQRTKALQDKQTAITGLSTLLYSIQYLTDNLGKTDLYGKRSVTSSAPDILKATSSGTPALGTYQFTAVRTAQAQQFLGSGVASASDSLGGGSISLRFGDDLQRTAPLELIGSGSGFIRGKIRVVDRSGASATIDLSSAQTLEDVLTAINDNETVNVVATAENDRIRLTDQTGLSLANLKVQEVGGGKTAASLGLSQVDVAADTATGAAIYSLFGGLSLDQLNDGAGVRVDRVLDDIQYRLRDGTTGTIDLSPIISGSSEVDEDNTLSKLLERINAAAPEKLRVSIAADGQRLEIVDLTEGTETFELTSLYESKALEDLGLDVAAQGGTITGRRLIGGLSTVLLSSLGGGKGLGSLGSLSITDRGGAATTVDLSAAETLDDVILSINQAAQSSGVGIIARVNAAKTGIELTDTTGRTDGNLQVTSAGGSQTAEQLGIAVDAAVSRVDSGDLHLQVVSENTKLASLNGGAGVAEGSFTIYDSHGAKATIDLRASGGIKTIGELIRAINRTALSVHAELSDNGDGIQIRDLDNAGQELRIVEGSTTTARDLNLLGGAVERQIDGEARWVIDGRTTRTITLDSDDTLTDLRDKINSLGIPVSASIFSDGSAMPAHLALTSQRTGRAGALVVETAGLSFSLTETVRGQDALLAFGQGAAATLVASATNSFTGVIDGLDIDIAEASEQPVTVKVERSDTDVVASVTTMVENYNKFRDTLTSLTKYETETNTRGILTGDAAALRLDTELAAIFTSRYFGAGKFQSLAELGIGITDEGKLEFDEDVLRDAYASDPEAVEKFFSTEELGFSARIGRALDQLVGEENSLLARRGEALSDTIAENEARIEHMTALLASQEERLLMDFYNMEIAIGKLQTNLTALESLQKTWASSND
ncbi:MAG: flagellar filament capping protein FliD [Planctomycetota bacterium]